MDYMDYFEMETSNILFLFFIFLLIIFILVLFNLPVRLRSVIFLLPAWFSPHSRLRIFFHRLRGSKIGNNVHLGYCIGIDNANPQLVTIQDNAGLGMFVWINTHDYVDWPNRRMITDSVLIKEGAYIGVGSIILKGVTIGKESIVGAGSVVTKDVPDGAIAVGNPARIIEKKIE